MSLQNLTHGKLLFFSALIAVISDMVCENRVAFFLNNRWHFEASPYCFRDHTAEQTF